MRCFGVLGVGTEPAKDRFGQNIHYSSMRTRFRRADTLAARNLPGAPAQPSQPIRELAARPQFRLRPRRLSIGQKLRVSMEKVTEIRGRPLVGPGACPSLYINKRGAARGVPCCA